MKNRVDAYNNVFSLEISLSCYEMQMSIAWSAHLGAFPCCIVVGAFGIREQIDIRKGIRDIRSSLSTRYRRARQFTAPALSQLPRIFVSLTGIEKPVLQPGLRPRARMKLWFPIVLDADTRDVLNCFLLRSGRRSERVAGASHRKHEPSRIR